MGTSLSLAKLLNLVLHSTKNQGTQNGFFGFKNGNMF